jgi:hypothetical protein
MGECRKCQQVVRQQCDDDICDFVVPAKCVAVEATDCTTAGTLQDVIEELCTTTTTNGEKSTYDIISVCDLTDGFLQLVITPNFSFTTPNFINVFAVVEIEGIEYEVMLFNFLKTPLVETVEGEDFEYLISMGELNLTLKLFDETDIKLRIIDNEGNYSELTTLELTLCE